jgi:transposase
MQKRIMFVGMDVHQKSIDITTAEQGHDGKVAHFGCIGGDLQSLDTAVDKLMESGAELRLVYEAGPCGYVIYRHLTGRGLHCTLVSPASVPKRPSDRVKTDRRDARTLALQHRAGALRAIYVPEPEDEAVRDLVRGREDAVHNRRRARQRLNSFMLRHGRRYSGKKKWSLAHRRWVAAQSFSHAAQRVTLEEYVGAIEEAEGRVERLSSQIQALVVAWRLKPYVDALQALRGVSWVVAVTVVAEVGDLSRFQPRRLMAFLGLVPSEYSSGERRRQGAITKSGNGHVRRVLGEAAWAYVHQPAISARVLKRQEELSKEIREVAWKAQLRLCPRFNHLSAQHKQRNKIVTAIARELVGFMWAIARCVAQGGNQTKEAERSTTTPPDTIVLRRRPRPQSRNRARKVAA